MPNRPVLLCSAALLILALAGCSGGDDSTDNSTSSASESPATTSPEPTESASPSESATPSPEPSMETPEETAAAAEATPVETAAPEEAPANDTAATGISADAQSVFDAGFDCSWETFPAGDPGPDLITELQSICTEQTGAPIGGDTTGAGEDYVVDSDATSDTSSADSDGYERPEADEDGYVGPSDEYYAYDGYVEPGFEYQVGSECFDPDLGRCKSSGEIQTEYMEGVEVEELMEEQGIPLPSEQ